MLLETIFIVSLNVKILYDYWNNTEDLILNLLRNTLLLLTIAIIYFQISKSKAQFNMTILLMLGVSYYAGFSNHIKRLKPLEFKPYE